MSDEPPPEQLPSTVHDELSFVTGPETLSTYRYLRLAILAAVLALGVSVLFERFHAPGCWQTSISAYYYTPVRSIFVGALVTIGVCLVVFKSERAVEDIALNVAGMLAPVVAVVPTSEPGTCYSVRPGLDPRDSYGGLASWVVAGVRNNVSALLITGVITAVVVIALSSHRRPKNVVAAVKHDPVARLVVSAIVSLALIATGTILYANWKGFNTNAHFVAAISMFGFLAVAVFRNAFRAGRFKRVYLVVGCLMIVSGALLVTSFDHAILVVELIEITLFSTFWTLQTKEGWTLEGAADLARPD